MKYFIKHMLYHDAGKQKSVFKTLRLLSQLILWKFQKIVTFSLKIKSSHNLAD